MYLSNISCYASLVDVAIIAAHKLMVAFRSVTNSHYVFKREMAYELCTDKCKGECSRLARERVFVLPLCKWDFYTSIKAISVQQTLNLKQKSKDDVLSILDRKIRKPNFFVDHVKTLFATFILRTNVQTVHRQWTMCS